MKLLPKKNSLEDMCNKLSSRNYESKTHGCRILPFDPPRNSNKLGTNSVDEKNKRFACKIIMKNDIPSNTVCIPWIKSGETVIIVNIDKMIKVVVDNSQVCSDYIKENKMENYVIVGDMVVTALGIDDFSAVVVVTKIDE